MQYSGTQPVPFKIPNVNYGFHEAKGLLKIQKEGLQMEFEVQDAFFGLMNSGIRTIRVPFGQLQSIRFKKGWFRGSIILEAKTMRVFEALPGSEQGTSTLRVKRKDREAAQNLISKARLRLSEQRLEELDDEDPG